MAQQDIAQSELLFETQRTTHAVRAIARFLILEVTYGVIGAVLLVLGALSLLADDDSGLSVLLLVGGVATLIAGLIHSLQAGWDELNKSNRLEPPVANSSEPDYEAKHPTDEIVQLQEGVCDCHWFIRGSGNTGGPDGIKYCGRCMRPKEA